MLSTTRKENKAYWINNDVHRSSPVRIKAPALVRQVACWYNDQQETSLAAIWGKGSVLPIPFPGTLDLLENYRTRDYLDFIIVDLFRTLRLKLDPESRKRLSLGPCVDNTVLLFGKAYNQDCTDIKSLSALKPRQKDIFFNEYRSVTLEFPWCNFCFVTIRFELHTEHFTALTCIDVKEAFADLNAGDPTNSDVEAALQNLAKRILKATGTPEPPVPESLKKFFYETVWDLFAADLLASEKIIRYRGHDLFQGIFADFRGLIFSDELLKFPYAAFEKPTWGAEAGKKLLPFVSEANRWECTANYMLDGQVLYMSALGPQAPEISDDQRAPVTYVLYVHHQAVGGLFDGKSLFGTKRLVTRWQLGRLIDRIHLLGTVRLAALRDLRALHQAGESLARLEVLVKQAREAGFLVGDGDSDDPSASVSLDLIQDAQKHFNRIGSTYFAVTGSATGLMYRIERSRYYVPTSLRYDLVD
jgi:hypothetical protein